MSENYDLVRVRGRIGPAIKKFAAIVGTDDVFSADRLRSFVIQEAHVAPASPDRILRDLRRRHALDYVVVDRSGSLYRFTRVPS